MFATSLVVAKHSVSVLHGENFIVDTAVITILVSQVVELLAKLGNQLVFFGGSDSHSGILFHISDVSFMCNLERRERCNLPCWQTFKWLCVVLVSVKIKFNYNQ